MTRRGRDEPLPDVMQGRWVSLDQPAAELIVIGSDITCFGARVEYDIHEDLVHEDGALRSACDLPPMLTRTRSSAPMSQNWS